MKHLFILLSHPHTLTSGMIGRITGEAYTHASLACAAPHDCFYAFARKYAPTPIPGGLVRERLDSGFFGRYPATPCALLRLPVADEIHARIRAELADMFERRRIYHYNILGLLACRLGVETRTKKNCFCSQFVGSILERYHVAALPKAPSLLHPQDFFRLPEAECVYRGTVRGLREKTDIGEEGT